jgi:hypothetical protein
MNIPNSIDRDRILLRLETFRFVAEANVELLENDARLKEQFSLGIQRVLDYLNELDVHGKSGDEARYASALDSAELALARVHDLINDMLDQ